MEQVKKMKVALICNFSTAEIRRQMHLKHDRWLFNYLIKIFRLPKRVGEYRDLVPWIVNMVREFEKRNDVEIHIIATHLGLSPQEQEFEYKGIFYHFYGSEFSSFTRQIDNLIIWKLLQRNSAHVIRFLDKINPDIINIIGIENPTTAISALYIRRKPVYVLSQTIYSNPDMFKYLKPKKINWDLEVLVHKKLKYFGVYSRLHYDLLKRNNPDTFVFDFSWPGASMPEVNELNKEYDFIHFANSISEQKGSFDTLKALALVKRKYPQVKLNIAGGCDEITKQNVQQLMDELGLGDNVEFTPFFEEQKDLFQHLKKAKFAVLPCKLDVTSGTMSQSMYYGLPIVVYKTTGTPKYNENKECALISEIGDINALADNMLLLMDCPEKAEQLKLNAKEYISNAKNNEVIIDRLIANYKSIISHYYDGIAIPQDLLFDIKKFPIYK